LSGGKASVKSEVSAQSRTWRANGVVVASVTSRRIGLFILLIGCDFVTSRRVWRIEED
jgi:hypothetical protein